MIVGACIALVMLPRHKMVRKDGSGVAIEQTHRKISLIGLGSDALAIFKAEFANPKLLALILLFYTSNFVYSYQFDGVSKWVAARCQPHCLSNSAIQVNGALFNVRTRGLNALCTGEVKCLDLGSFLVYWIGNDFLDAQELSQLLAHSLFSLTLYGLVA